MSTIKCNTLSKLDASASVPVDTVVNGTAKAWVNFNGTGTVAIRQAFNVSSVTDEGTGDYIVNFTVPMVDGNYAACITLGGSSGIVVSRTTEDITNRTTSLFNFITTNLSSTKSDAAVISATVFR